MIKTIIMEKKQHKFNRRKLLRMGGVLGVGMMASPELLWSKAIEEAREKKEKFIFQSDSISEFTPPQLPNLKTLKARLHWNENPYGPNPKALTAFNEVAKSGNFYSWDSLNEFTDKIAEKEGVATNQIMTGPGSSDLLEKTAVVLFQNGGNVVSADPSYMSLIQVVRASGGEWKPVKLTPDFQHDLDAMEAAIDSETKLVYITNPNNPTATKTDTKKLYDFCDRVSQRVPVFIDEAYLELTDEGLSSSMAPLVAKGRDIFVTRTFSKIHGMAGLRMGYMLASQKQLSKINQITRGGMGISGPTIKAAMASLTDTEFLESCKEKLVSNRVFTVNALKARGFDPMPSQANFIIFELPKTVDPNAFLTAIYARKITVKAMRFWDTNWCRVSVGTAANMEMFIEAVDDLLV